ncbi:HAD family hydrolase [Tautonia plasticadhaerens]|uniref:Beta-phosphoglucomutase n=1 Tax=Tautonia plasticadhaerens TaxID=2527974 RepID=A0A518HAM3_9BACT|nr:HAD family phosphatase [Tautonia plasticadhaerens]QDV37879.1 Beta-phosphoglucomutase [Tautonia plasticadhaerens]
MPEPRAVLFDFDGVIADTENVHVAAWERTFALMGLDVPPEQCSKAAELDDRPFLAEILEGKGIEGGAIDGWVGRKQQLAAAMLRDEPRLYPGVVGLIRRLQDRASLAVVSTARRGDVALVLSAGGIADAFGAMVGKEDVSNTKPDPEPYRTALERLGLAAEEAVAIEDSAAGLASARGAGIRCLAVGHRHGMGVWVGESPFLEDLADEEAVLEALGFVD